ncbi:permease [Clostridium zeae]|uniref:Permease n=1 Tax=Clostridium zeae TaxID=2759022 RepID=A0ABQ1E8F7_9CLOT|nr:AEC family transporter [Clostridium zeae]GFZ31067.1 permease [Clostridium zeae]
MDLVLIKAAGYVCIIIIGYLLKKIGLFDSRDQTTVMKIIMNITLPAAVVSAFSNFQKDVSLISITFIGLLMNLIMSGIGYLIALKRDNNNKAFNIINYSGYNIGTFAMPYLQSFLGSMGVIVACLFDAGNAIMCTGVTYAIASQVTKKEKNSVKDFLLKVFSSVPFDVYLVMLFCYFANIKFPKAVYSIASLVGNANAFLAMFMIGLSFELVFEKSVLKQVWTALIIRYSLNAVFAYIVYNFMPFGKEVKIIVVLIMFAPMSALNVINTIKCGGSKEKSGLVNSLSILISLVIITLLVVVLKLG